MNLTKLTILEARKLLDKKEISSVELTQSTIDRIKKIDPVIGAFISFDEDFALKQAKKADELISSGSTYPLTGIPFQLKDNICTTEIPTTCASKILKNFIPPYNATVTNKIYDQGAVLVGKGNLDEFAMGSSTENSAIKHTKNPWDFNLVPGGSSGGGAAAVASGECMFALGSDTGGSIRQPAAFCGIVGLKPTYGLVSRYGLIAFASSLDQIGPLTRTVADNALVLEAIAGNDPHDATSITTNYLTNYLDSINEDLSEIQVGIPIEYWEQNIEPKFKSSLKTVIETLKDIGVTLKEISLPLTEQALPVYYLIANSEASSNLSRYDGIKYGYVASDTKDIWETIENTKGEGFGPEVKRRILLGTYALSTGFFDQYYLKAQKVRTLIIKEFKETFDTCDVIIAPTSPSVAFPIGSKITNPLDMYMNDIFTQPANIAGIPAISIPGGFYNNLPFGIQFIGNYLSEKTLFTLANAYEKASSFTLTNNIINETMENQLNKL